MFGLPAPRGRLLRTQPGARSQRALASAATVALLATGGCSAQSVAQAPASTPQTLATPRPAAASPTRSPAASRAASPAASPAPRRAAAAVRSATAVSAATWPTFGRTNSRSGALPHMPAVGHVTKGFTARLDGAVYAQPLLIGSRLIVATEGGSLYSLSPLTGRVQWRSHLGTPAQLSTLPCGNIDPLGITGTPVYDTFTHLVYAVIETTGAHHSLVAVDPATGAVKLRRNVDPPGVSDPRPYQQRAALLQVGRRIYVAYGGLAGDCGNYIGTILGVPDTGTTGAITRWRPATPREGGMWNTAGPALAPNGHLLIPVGNGAVSGGTFDGSDSLTELTVGLVRAGYFAPSQWGNDNAGDQDLSSGSPALVTIRSTTGSTTYAVIVGKSGTAYLTKVGALGGIGGERRALAACRSLGTSATYGTTVVQTCPISGTVMAFTVGFGTLTKKWTANINGWGPSTGGGRVFMVDRNGRFVVLSVASGHLVTSVALGDSVPHFVAPMLTNTSAYVGTDHGVVQVRLAP